MSARVWRQGGEVLKQLGDPALVAHLVARTGAVRAAGVATPEVRPAGEPGVVAFAEITGSGGLALIAERGAGALAGLMRPLAVLHRATVAGLSDFDALRRIAPRLSADDPGWIGGEISRCLDAVRPGPAAVLHGDFHAGQVIRDHAGTVWMLDLDDLATGPPEADLGNFAAHLATRPETRRGTVRAGFDDWLGEILVAHPGHCRPGPAHAFGRLALIRRALKLREQGDPSVLDELSRDAGGQA